MTQVPAARSTLGTLIANPATPLGPIDDIMAARFAEENPPESGSFGDSFIQSFAGGPTGVLFRKAKALGFERDPEFKLTQQVLDDYTRPEYGVDADLWDKYADAVSHEHAEYIHETNMMIMEKRKALSKGGFGSFSGNILGSLADPGTVAVGLLTGGAGFATRVGIAGNAAIAGGSNILLTGIQASEDPGITGMDVLRAGVGGAGFGAVSAAGIRSVGTRVLAGAAGQALPPLAVDFLMDDRPGNQVLMDLGVNLAFGGLFNALPPADATPAQVRMAEKVHNVGVRMKETADGLSPDYTDASPAILNVLQLDEWTPPKEFGFPEDITGKPYSDESILGPANKESNRILSTKTFASKDAADAHARTLPNATVTKLFDKWLVAERDRSFRSTGVSNLTPADIVDDIGLRRTVESLAAKGMTAGEIQKTLADWLPRFEDERVAKRFIDDARRDFSIPSRNKPEELSSWAARSGYDTTPATPEFLDSLRANMDATIAAELARKNLARRGAAPSTPEPDPATLIDPNASLVTGRIASDKASVRVAETAPPPSAMGAATAADTAKETLDAPADPFDFDVSEIARTAYATPKASYSKKFNIGGVDLGALRWDMVGMVGGSEIPEFRAAARITGLDWVPDETGAPITYSAYEWVQDRYKASLGDTYGPSDRAYAAHAEAATKAGTPLMSKDDFAVNAGKAARRGEQHADPNVAATAKVYRKAFNDLHERALRHNVDIGYTPDYLPRRYNAGATDSKAMDIGRRMLPDRDEATQYAKGREVIVGMYERAQAAKNAPKPVQVNFRGKKVTVPSTDGPEILRARAEAIFDKGGRSTTEDITAGRIVLDETYREQIPMPDGSTYDIGVEDLIENDIRVLFASYSHQLHGKMAIAKLGQVFGQEIDGAIEVSESVGQIVQVLEQKARESGRPEATWRPDLEKIETILKQTAGMPLYQSTGTSRTLDGIRKLNSIRSMANVGSSINNSIELVGASAEIGGKYVAARVVPAMNEVIAAARNGESSSQMVKDLYRMGIGIDRTASRILPRLGDDLSQPIGKTAAELMLARGERLAFDVSLQSYTTDASRLTVSWAYFDRWADIAHAGNGFSEARLALQGLSKRDESAILDQIRQHAVWLDKPGGTLDHMGFENWDPNTRRIFQQATSRTARRLVQENSPTSYARWMTGPVGKMLSQFRTFAFTAHTAKFLTEMKTRDATTGYIIAATSVGAMALYTARTLLDAAVRDDKKQFLEDRLSLNKLAAAAYSRAAWSALFPTAIDTLVSDIGRQDPWFSYARTTGLRGGGILGNPTVDFLKETGFNPLDFDPLKVPRAIAAPLIPGYDFSQQDWRAMKAGLAIPDILNLRKLADEYAKDLPTMSQ